MYYWGRNRFRPGSYRLLAGEGPLLCAAVSHLTDGFLGAGAAKGHVLFTAFAE